jgi:putative tricarboxylic transport membrane protein
MSEQFGFNAKRRRLRAGAVACAGLFALGGLSASGAIAAPAWEPGKPVELVVPSGTGGGNDRIARLMQQLMQQNKLINVPTTVVNKPGGGQAVTYAYLGQQAGDGHYLATATMNMLTNRIMGSNPLSYRDLTPIVQLTRYYLTFAVKADSPIKSFKEVAARLRSDPQSLVFGVSSGAFPSITVGMVGVASGAEPGKLKRVVFRSGGEVTTAILGGHVDIVAAAPTSILAQHKSGTVRIIGVSAPKRLGGAFAEVPTIREQGVDVVSANWYNLVGPPKVPAAQVAFWENVFEKAVETPEWKKEVEVNAWDDSFLKGKDLMRALQEQEAELEKVLRAMGQSKQK